MKYSNEVKNKLAEYMDDMDEVDFTIDEFFEALDGIPKASHDFFVTARRKGGLVAFIAMGNRGDYCNFLVAVKGDTVTGIVNVYEPVGAKYVEGSDYLLVCATHGAYVMNATTLDEICSIDY